MIGRFAGALAVAVVVAAGCTSSTSGETPAPVTESPVTAPSEALPSGVSTTQVIRLQGILQEANTALADLQASLEAEDVDKANSQATALLNASGQVKSALAPLQEQYPEGEIPQVYLDLNTFAGDVHTLSANILKATDTKDYPTYAKQAKKLSKQAKKGAASLNAYLPQ